MTQTLQLKNVPSEVEVLSLWLDRFADEQELPAMVRGNLQVALEEVALNVILHGYGKGGATRNFTVALTPEADYVTAVVTDDAPAFDPLSCAEVDTTLPLEKRSIGGLGIHLVKSLMETVTYKRLGGQNILTLRCRRKSAAETERAEHTVT